MRRFLSIWLASLLALVVAGVAVADIKVYTTNAGSVKRHTVSFDSGDAINAISKKFDTCSVMSVRFFQANASDVTLYEVDPDDTTVSEYEGGTSVVAFTSTSTAPTVFRPGSLKLAFVVDDVETAGESVAVIDCISTSAGDSDIGFTLCDAETTAGICEGSVAADTYASVTGFRSFTVTFSETGGSGNACHIHAGDYILARSVPADLSVEGVQITTIALSSSVTSWTFSRPTSLLWANCTVGTGNFTIDLLRSSCFRGPDWTLLGN